MTSASVNRLWAVVPLKSPDTAKSRLGGHLRGGERRQLFFALARHVIGTLNNTPGISRIAVVTSSNEVEAFAEGLGARVIRQPADAGTAAAFAAAVTQLHEHRLDRLLMIAGDLPLLSVAAVTRLIGGTESAPRIVLAPDQRRLGTNALLCAPPQAIAPCFGEDSFSRHLQSAQAQAIPAEVLDCPELALDVDYAEDLDELRARLGAGGHSTSPELVNWLHDVWSATAAIRVEAAA